MRTVSVYWIAYCEDDKPLRLEDGPYIDIDHARVHLQIYHGGYKVVKQEIPVEQFEILN